MLVIATIIYNGEAWSTSHIVPVVNRLHTLLSETFKNCFRSDGSRVGIVVRAVPQTMKGTNVLGEITCINFDSRMVPEGLGDSVREEIIKLLTISPKESCIVTCGVEDRTISVSRPTT